MSRDPSAPNETITVVTVTEAGRTYPFEEAARLVSLHPDLLRHYCHVGLLGPQYAEITLETRFDDTAIYWLRRIERTRRQYGIDRATLPLLCALWHRIEQLEAEVRFLRGT